MWEATRVTVENFIKTVFFVYNLRQLSLNQSIILVKMSLISTLISNIDVTLANTDKSSAHIVKNELKNTFTMPLMCNKNNKVPSTDPFRIPAVIFISSDIEFAKYVIRDLIFK